MKAIMDSCQRDLVEPERKLGTAGGSLFNGNHCFAMHLSLQEMPPAPPPPPPPPPPMVGRNPYTALPRIFRPLFSRICLSTTFWLRPNISKIGLWKNSLECYLIEAMVAVREAVPVHLPPDASIATKMGRQGGRIMGNNIIYQLESACRGRQFLRLAGRRRRDRLRTWL